MSGFVNDLIFGTTKRNPTHVALPKRWFIGGQSNAAGINADPTYGGAAITAGVTVYLAGVSIATWPAAPGPAPYIVATLLGLGVAAAEIIIVIEAVNGSTITQNTDAYFESAVSVWRTLGTEPEAIFYWQGEAETQTETEALQYEDNLVHLCKKWVDAWSEVNIYIMLLLHEDSGYGAYYATTRASQVAALTRVGGSYTVDSHVPTYLDQSDTVHASIAGQIEAVSRLFSALS